MNIRCGNCKQIHSSIAEVRRCFGTESDAAPATAAQVRYAQALMRDRIPTAEYADMPEDRINGMSKPDISAFISSMKDQPHRAKMVLEIDHEDVPEGYYALSREDGTVDFYKLVDWREGRVLFQVFGSPGALEKRRVNRPEFARLTMAAIAANPEAASLLFGKALGTCGVCGSPLTNEESRIAGIGPICSKKRGWG